MVSLLGVGRRTDGHAAYNPLSDGFQEAPADLWYCVAEEGVPYYSSPSDSGAPLPGKKCTHGTKITGKKEGNWIKTKDTNLYLPYKNKETGKRMFKNHRMVLLEERSKENEVGRYWSGSSMESFDYEASGPLRFNSSATNYSQEGALKRTYSQGSIEAEQSTWICCASLGVPYYTEASFEADRSGTCVPGKKVRAIKEGDWLHVVEVKETVDVLGTLGRRSLKMPRQTSYTEATLYLPLVNHETGARLFKNEKVEAYERARARTASGGSEVTRTKTSSEQWNVTSTGSMVSEGYELKRQKSQGSIETEESVWICVSQVGIDFHLAADLAAGTSGTCKSGQRIHAVKEGDWLKVVNVKEQIDVMQALTLRSVRAPTRQRSVEEACLWLPLVCPETGARLFKNEKIELWERAKGRNTIADDDQAKSCSLM